MSGTGALADLRGALAGTKVLRLRFLRHPWACGVAITAACTAATHAWYLPKASVQSSLRLRKATGGARLVAKADEASSARLFPA